MGNPPYIPLESFSDVDRSVFKKKFQQFERKYETSVMFIVEGMRLLTNQGLLSFIAPVTWQTGENYVSFRKFLLHQKGVKQIINLPFNIFRRCIC